MGSPRLSCSLCVLIICFYSVQLQSGHWQIKGKNSEHRHFYSEKKCNKKIWCGWNCCLNKSGCAPPPSSRQQMGELSLLEWFPSYLGSEFKRCKEGRQHKDVCVYLWYRFISVTNHTETKGKRKRKKGWMENPEQASSKRSKRKLRSILHVEFYSISII